MGLSLLDLLNQASSAASMTKSKFGSIMNDPNATEEEKAEALRQMQEAGGYENLGD